MKPSVTQLIQLLDKPALLKWANKIGLQGIDLDTYRSNSKKNGTNLHNEIENYVKNKIPFSSIEVQNNFINFFENKEILEIEKNIECEYFKGRLDIILNYKNQKYICDFKSNQTNVYFENILQLVAYKMCENCNNIAIVSIPNFELININISNYEPEEEILKSLSNIYKLKNQIKYGN